MDKNTRTRLKIPEIKKHPFNKNIDWTKVLNKEYEPPSFTLENNNDEDELSHILPKKVIIIKFKFYLEYI